MASEDSANVTSAPSEAGPKGVGGWLWLPIASLIFLLIQGVRDLPEILATPVYGRPELHPLTVFPTFLVIGDVVLFIVAPLVILLAMIMKLRAFVLVYCVWAFCLPVFMIGNQWRDLVGGGAETVLLGTGNYVLWAGIWIAYMVRSRRVKNTFVN